MEAGALVVADLAPLVSVSGVFRTGRNVLRIIGSNPEGRCVLAKIRRVTRLSNRACVHDLAYSLAPAFLLATLA